MSGRKSRLAEEGMFARFRRRCPDASGISILEQALVYPVLLGIIIGAVDISRILQGYSVLDQGIRSALRCATPANGDCISPASRGVQPLYDIYQSPDQRQYRIQQHRYTGEAGWVALPVHQIDRIEAAIVDSVSFSAAALSQQMELKLFRPSGVVGFALETRSFPALDVSASGPMVPRLLVSPGSSQIASATLALGVSNLSLRYRARTSPGQRNILRQTARFTLQPEMLFDNGIRDLRAGEGCFRSAHDRGSEPDFSARCNSALRFSGARLHQQIESARRAISPASDIAQEVSQYAFIVLDIRGRANVSGSIGGAVELSMSQSGGVSRSLGGRRFDASGESNFVPRGAPVENYSSQFRARYSEEIQNYQAIMVKLGVPVELEFTLVPDRAEAELLEWQPASIEVFAPHYRSVQAAAECEDLSSRARFEQLRAAVCRTSRHPAGMPRSESVALAPEAEKTLVEHVCVTDSTAPREALAQRGIEEAGNYHPVGIAVPGQCGSVQREVACPPNNGHAALTLPGGSQARVVCNSVEARQLCPVPQPAEKDSLKTCWTIRAREIPLEGEPRWTQRDCRQNAPLPQQLPVKAQSFASLRITSHRLLDEEDRFYTAGEDPRDFINREKSFQCGEISPRSIMIGDDLTLLEPDSLFRSTLPLGADYRNRLFQDAQHNFIDPALNIDPGAWFTAREQLESVLADSPPANPSQIYWVEPKIDPKWNLLSQRVRSDEIPAACFDPKTVCRQELVDVVRTSMDSEQPVLLSERGEARGFEAISAAMPGLVKNCQSGSKACVDLTLEEENDAQGKLFVARGEIRVPLILSPVPFTISRVARGRWEREFVNR